MPATVVIGKIAFEFPIHWSIHLLMQKHVITGSRESLDRVQSLLGDKHALFRRRYTEMMGALTNQIREGAEKLPRVPAGIRRRYG